MTNKAGVERDKDRGMAPLGWRVVRHAMYMMPFFVNPSVMRKSGCQKIDIDLLKFIVPHAYKATASAVRPCVHIHHAWYAEHKSPLGSCPDTLIIDAMSARKLENPEEPSQGLDEYDIPTALPAQLRQRLDSFEDLCTKVWN